MISIGSKLDAKRGVGPGFDTLRVALSSAVVFSHSSLLLYGEKTVPGAWYKYWGFLDYLIVPMFFALSGFLVTASAIRQPLTPFIANRAFRIFPALIVETLLSALILGPALTTLTLGAYFSSPDFWAYSLNIFGYIHYVLPGVFENNPLPVRVNGSMYTIPYELQCYILMSCFILLKVFHTRLRFVVSLLCAVTVLFAASRVSRWISTDSVNELTFTARLVGYFLMGSVAYNLRYRIPYSLPLFLGFAAVIAFISSQGMVNRIDGAVPGYMRLLSAPVAIYIIVFLGVTDVPKLPLYSRGDYSYGIYLYGFPIQQTIVQLIPSMSSVLLLFVLSMVGATAMAMLSWHFIEAPVLRLRKVLIRRESKTSQVLAERFETRPDAEMPHPQQAASAVLPR